MWTLWHHSGWTQRGPALPSGRPCSSAGAAQKMTPAGGSRPNQPLRQRTGRATCEKRWERRARWESTWEAHPGAIVLYIHRASPMADNNAGPAPAAAARLRAHGRARPACRLPATARALSCGRPCRGQLAEGERSPDIRTPETGGGGGRRRKRSRRKRFAVFGVRGPAFGHGAARKRSGAKDKSLGGRRERGRGPRIEKITTPKSGKGRRPAVMLTDMGASGSSAAYLARDGR